MARKRMEDKITMNKETYKELREIEDKLYDIVYGDGEEIDHDLGDIWFDFYCYLEKINLSEL